MKQIIINFPKCSRKGSSILSNSNIKTRKIKNNFIFDDTLQSDNSGYISTRELRKLSAKLSEDEIQALMVKVSCSVLIKSVGCGFVKQQLCYGTSKSLLEELFTEIFDS